MEPTRDERRERRRESRRHLDDQPSTLLWCRSDTTCARSCAKAIRSPRVYGIRTDIVTPPREASSAIRPRSDVDALAREARDEHRPVVPPSERIDFRGQAACRSCCRRPRAGVLEAPISCSTSRTACIWASRWAAPASATWSSRSASLTSSSVDLNASTSPCGSLWMKPTVSVSVTSRPSGRLEPARGGVERREQHVRPEARPRR